MRFQTSSKNEIRLDRYGFTLIEVMVATLILTVGLLGMFQGINIAMDQGVETQLRQRGVEVSEQHMSDLKARPFSNITGTTRLSVRTAIGSVFKNMSVESRAVDLAALNSQTKQISVRVWWRHRGRLYEHQTASGIGITDGSTGQ